MKKSTQKEVKSTCQLNITMLLLLLPFFPFLGHFFECLCRETKEKQDSLGSIRLFEKRGREIEGEVDGK